MYDYDKAAAAVKKFHDDFQPDYQVGAVAPARVFELLGLNLVQWPGGALSDETPWQYVESEYMGEDEYDALIADPEAFFRRTLLPRFGSAFGSLAGLSPFTDMMEATTMLFSLLPFADPAVLEGVQRLTRGGPGVPQVAHDHRRRRRRRGGPTGHPPVDGRLRQSAVRHPGRHAAGHQGHHDGPLPPAREDPRGVRAPRPGGHRVGRAPGSRSDAPLITFVLHKGADSFMSDADFKNFYWPTLKAVMKGLIAEGIVPFMFAEGGYNKRLEAIADDDLPTGSVVWLFDQTDMFAAKRALGGRAAIAGNVPTRSSGAGDARRGREVRHGRAGRVRQRRRRPAAERRRARRRQSRES